MAVNIPIWAGSSSFFPGDTPYGFYDTDAAFQCDIEKAAVAAGLVLGFPINDVELQDINFYSAFEQAVTEYGYWVNTYAARDNVMTLMGLDTGSLQLQQEYVQPSSTGVFKLAEEYATATGVGGTLTHYTASLTLRQGQQIYDLKTDPSMSLETGSFATDSFTIRRIYYEIPPALVRYFDPYVSTGLSSQTMLSEFSWGNYSPGISFVLMPVYYDILRLQAIEFNDLIRKSQYSFKLTNDRLQIFPIPPEGYKLWIDYTLDGDILSNINSNKGKISDHSNVPYYNVKYSRVNDIGKRWIHNYFIALCKEMLGRVRGKYGELPIPNGAISLNYTELLQEGESEQQRLRDELKEILDSFSNEKQLEKKANEAAQLAAYLQYVPMRIYTG